MYFIFEANCRCWFSQQKSALRSWALSDFWRLSGCLPIQMPCRLPNLDCRCAWDKRTDAERRSSEVHGWRWYQRSHVWLLWDRFYRVPRPNVAAPLMQMTKCMLEGVLQVAGGASQVRHVQLQFHHAGTVLWSPKLRDAKSSNWSRTCFDHPSGAFLGAFFRTKDHKSTHWHFSYCMKCARMHSDLDAWNEVKCVAPFAGKPSTAVCPPGTDMQSPEDDEISFFTSLKRWISPDLSFTKLPQAVMRPCCVRSFWSHCPTAIWRVVLIQIQFHSVIDVWVKSSPARMVSSRPWICSDQRK